MHLSYPFNGLKMIIYTTDTMRLSYCKVKIMNTHYTLKRDGPNALQRSYFLDNNHSIIKSLV